MLLGSKSTIMQWSVNNLELFPFCFSWSNWISNTLLMTISDFYLKASFIHINSLIREIRINTVHNKRRQGLFRYIIIPNIWLISILSCLNIPSRWSLIWTLIHILLVKWRFYVNPTQLIGWLYLRRFSFVRECIFLI